MSDAPVMVAHGALPHAWDTEVACVTTTYDVGLRTRAAVRRQLAVDLPRSEVRVAGVRASTADEVLRAMSVDLARLCTQAVLAPPVEWLLAHGLVAHEVHDGGPMQVDADGGTVRVSKRLGLRTWEDDLGCGESRGALRITVFADAQCVVVSLERQLDTS